jgi:hypothetical protein
MATSQPHYSDNPSIFPAEGGCVCGLIRYSINMAPLIVHCCHCTACQREQGSAFAINIVIETSQFQLLPYNARPVIPSSCPRNEDDSDGTTAESEEELIYAKPDMPAPSTLGIIPRAEQGEGEGGNEVYEPRMVSLPTQSGYAHTLARCPRCFVAVYSEYAGSGPHSKFSLTIRPVPPRLRLYVYLSTLLNPSLSIAKFVVGGTLDKPWQISPDVHIFTRSKRDFVDIKDDKPQCEVFYDRAKTWRPEAIERYEALMPVIQKWREERSRVGSHG